MSELELQPLNEMQRSWVLRPVEKKKKKISSRRIFFGVISATVVAAALIGWKVPKTSPRHQHKQPLPPDSYTVALHKALNFFNAQKSGELPSDNNISWRANSGLNDGNYPGNPNPDLVGGYYDGGDAIKSSFPMSFSMTMLSWSVIEYHPKYKVIGELDHVKGLIKWGTDYLLKTFSNNTDTIRELVFKVGSERNVVPSDHSCWMRPEDIDYKRPVYVCYDSCSNLAAEMAAALASASIVFKDDRVYSQKLLHGAKILYKYAESMKRSSRMSWDELLWGGTWMYYATGDLSYLERVTSHSLAKRAGAFSYGPDYGVFSRDTKLAGAQLLLTRLRMLLGPGYPYEELLRIFNNQIDRIMCSYLPYFNKFNRTEGGLILLNHGDPKPLQYAANAAFLAALFSDILEASNTPGFYCGPTFYRTQVLRDFAKSQVDYILGKNPQNMSYVVGFGMRYPKHVHHRGASIPKNEEASCKGGWKWAETKQENPNTIEGAMVAGPDKHDVFHDVRINYNYTEPTLAGNAGLVAALVGMPLGEKTMFDKLNIFSAITPMYPIPPPQQKPWTP